MRSSRSFPARRTLLSVPLLLAVATLAPPGSSRAGEDGPWSRPLATRYHASAPIDVDVREISALAILPGGTRLHTSLLAVTDEGPYDPKKGVVTGALYRLEVRHEADGPHIERTAPVSLHVHFDRFDPGWPASVSPMDLEAVARVPGREDLYLLAGERNPEDRTDDGANRLYLVRYPAGDDGRAEVIRYYRVEDLVDDATNDRFEGLALLPKTEAVPGAWRLYAFKERTARPGAVPGYVRGTLADPSFDLRIEGDRGYPPLVPERLAGTNDVVSSQSDALATPDGEVWVLDRWRREIHVTRPDASGVLRVLGHLDVWDAVKGILGEVGFGPPPPGALLRLGYGTQEALTVDGFSRLYLASDRSQRLPSTLLVLEPVATRTAENR